ncbi:cupin domain-containing protein [Xylariales sp. AK1849]|nr:cupin domain-containing protein [Xylariales sp. AK1849]
MAPRQPAQRRNQQSSQNEHVYALGVRGRKTGVTLEDTGVRDEYGMEPVDALFSSPEKGANARTQIVSEDEQDMDIDEASSPGPATVSRMRNRLSIPKARSPLKTYLNSPARQNPHLARSSSPVRGSVVEENRLDGTATSAKRRLDFAQDPRMKPISNGHAKVNGSSHSKKANGHVEDDTDDGSSVLRRRKSTPPIESAEEDDEEELMDFLDMGGDDAEPPQDDYDEEEAGPEQPEEEEEEEEEEEAAPVEEIKPKKRGRKPKVPFVEEEAASEPEQEAEPEHVEEPVKKRRGRPAAKKAPAEEEEEQPEPEPAPAPAPAPKSPKRRRGRPSLNSQADESIEAEAADAAEERDSKRQKTETKARPSKAEAKAPAAKGKPGRKRKSSGVGVDSPAVLPRPPMPKRRGLVTSRRDELEVKMTRSGRVSTKPLEFWRGEHYDLDADDEETLADKGGRRIKIGTKIKGVVRVEYEEAEAKPKKRRGRPGGSTVGRPRRRVSDVEEEAEREDWEEDPGRMTGECIYWYPDYEFHPPQDEDRVEVAEEELAISQAAIQMKDIKDASFQFAKTLTLPFFGSGIVDLPPHSEKRTKNARKMQMVFFVHYGNVEVTIAQTVFRIGKGGMWFVPRGNHYSITNDTEQPARMFFCQGCEVLVQAAESQEM